MSQLYRGKLPQGYGGSYTIFPRPSGPSVRLISFRVGSFVRQFGILEGLDPDPERNVVWRSPVLPEGSSWGQPFGFHAGAFIGVGAVNNVTREEVLFVSDVPL